MKVDKLKRGRAMSDTRVLILDFETRSFCDLKEHGAWIYSQHGTTEVIAAAWKFSDDDAIYQTDRRAHDYTSLLNFKGPIVAHNYQFEYAMIVNVLIARHGWPAHFKDVSRYRCTMATAMRCGLPASLNDAGRALNIDNVKKAALGSKLVQKFSKPKKRRGRDVYEFNEPTEKDWHDMATYNAFDVYATEEIYNKLPKLHEDGFEAPIFELDKRMNVHGLHVDTAAVNELITTYDNNMDVAKRQAIKIAGLTRSNPPGPIITSSIGFKTWLNKMVEPGQQVENVQQFTLKKLFTVTKNDTVKRAIKLRRTLSAASAKKIFKFRNYADSNDTVRGYIQYAGAHTLRWAGRGIQPQNFPRKSVDDFGATLSDLVNGRTDIIDTADIINSMLRQLIIPRPGNVFLIGDFAAIEARVTFWLSDCQKGLEAYRQGVDIYKEMAATIYHTTYSEVTDTQRALGKVAILGLGYGMGANKFFDTCIGYGINIDESLAEIAKTAYRSKYYEVPALWQKLERCVHRALTGNIAYHTFGDHSIEFKYTGSSLKVTLPSGRVQYYFKPGIDSDGNIRVNHPRMKSVVVWGGVFTENLVQAISRDLMAVAMLKCDKAEFPPVLTVHDEIVVEVNQADAEKRLIDFNQIMSDAPTWADGLPLGAECEIKERYCKI